MDAHALDALFRGDATASGAVRAISDAAAAWEAEVPVTPLQSEASPAAPEPWTGADALFNAAERSWSSILERLGAPSRVEAPVGAPRPPPPPPTTSAGTQTAPMQPQLMGSAFGAGAPPSRPQRGGMQQGPMEEEGDDDPAPAPRGPFVTARQRLARSAQERGGHARGPRRQPSNGGGGGGDGGGYHPVRSLALRGLKRRSAAPGGDGGEDDSGPALEGGDGPLHLRSSVGQPRQRRRLAARSTSAGPRQRGPGGGGYKPPRKVGEEEEEEEAEGLPEELKGLDPKLVEMIESEILDNGAQVRWEDIAGLDHAKRCVTEAVIWPMKRPDLFTGLRQAPKGLLLFGPPGTGKTLIGKAVAHQSGATFFGISASSLTSKWVGEGEKLVRTLFKVACYREPAVIFIDEIDSLLAQRSDKDVEASRRIKTEFLVQLDGVGTQANARILVVGATNRPQELDEAARRRFVKRLYIPLPCDNARRFLVKHLLSKNPTQVKEEDIEALVGQTKGFSGADVHTLCTEAAMGPIRDLSTGAEGNIADLSVSDVRPIAFSDFQAALRQVRPSVAPSEVDGYLEWNDEFGSFPRP